VTDENDRPAKKSDPYRAVVFVYLSAALFGLALAALSSRPAPAAGSSPRTRVGFALRAANLQGSAAAWAGLREDVEVVRSTLKDRDRDVFDLVIAARGLENGGSAQWSRTEEICHRLGWPRCDRAALEVLRKRSRP
jgi:hypothetical protein